MITFNKIALNSFELAKTTIYLQSTLLLNDSLLDNNILNHLLSSTLTINQFFNNIFDRSLSDDLSLDDSLLSVNTDLIVSILNNEQLIHLPTPDVITIHPDQTTYLPTYGDSNYDPEIASIVNLFHVTYTLTNLEQDQLSSHFQSNPHSQILMQINEQSWVGYIFQNNPNLFKHSDQLTLQFGAKRL